MTVLPQAPASPDAHSIPCPGVAEYVFCHICVRVHCVDIFLHPLFDNWLRLLSDEDTDDGTDWWEVRTEIAALLMALETYGRDLGDPECHEVVSTRFDMGALRRTPPTSTTPYAVGPPVLRILFAFVVDDDGEEAAVVLIGGDKTALGHRWYPPHVTRAEERLEQWCRQYRNYRPIVKRGGL